MSRLSVNRTAFRMCGAMQQRCETSPPTQRTEARGQKTDFVGAGALARPHILKMLDLGMKT
jgi:hypothetical protein